MRAEFPQFIVRDGVYRSGLRMVRHAHDYSNVSVVVAGEIEEACGGGEYRGHPFSVVFKPAGSEHENRVGSAGARVLTIELRQAISDRPWAWFDEPEIVRAAIALVRARSAPELETRGFELLAEVFAQRDTTAVPAWMNEVTRILDSRFDQPLRFEAIARQVGIHPVYLSRAFQRYTGRSMQQYVRALRLRRARQLLAARGSTITDVAADCGFADSSHLCRTFSDLLDVTPKVYRRLCGEV
jgi:AraC family transcriptional regulator